MLASTSCALVSDSAQLTGSAPRDRADHFAVAERDVTAKLLEVCRCVLPKSVSSNGVKSKNKLRLRCWYSQSRKTEPQRWNASIPVI